MRSPAVKAQGSRRKRPKKKTARSIPFQLARGRKTEDIRDKSTHWSSGHSEHLIKVLRITTTLTTEEVALSPNARTAYTAQQRCRVPVPGAATHNPTRGTDDGRQQQRWTVCDGNKNETFARAPSCILLRYCGTRDLARGFDAFISCHCFGHLFLSFKPLSLCSLEL